MLEMELKARINNKEQITEKLSRAGCRWSASVIQADVIYISKGLNQTINNPVFRIRNIDNKTILTLKVQSTDLNTAKELELEVSDDKMMHQMLQIIGFEARVELKKKRVETEYKGYTICMDEVERLGDFIEIEKLGTEDSEREREYEEMMKVLTELGIGEEDLVTDKYFEMIQKLEG